MTLQVKYKKLENDCFNLLTVDPNPPHDINHFSRFLRLENTPAARLHHDGIYQQLINLIDSSDEIDSHTLSILQDRVIAGRKWASHEDKEQTSQ